MSLASDLSAFRKPQKVCPVCEWYLTLDESDKKAFDDFVPNGGTRSALHRISVKHGLDCWRGKVYDHFDQGHEPR